MISLPQPLLIDDFLRLEVPPRGDPIPTSSPVPFCLCYMCTLLLLSSTTPDVAVKTAERSSAYSKFPGDGTHSQVSLADTTSASGCSGVSLGVLHRRNCMPRPHPPSTHHFAPWLRTCRTSTLCTSDRQSPSWGQSPKGQRGRQECCELLHNPWTESVELF